MKYQSVVKATFLSRPNRFIAMVRVDGKELACHVKNTGRCRELLVPGAAVYLEKGTNPNRKTAYDLIAVEKNGLLNKLFGLVGLGPFDMINTQGAVVLGMVYNYLPFMILPLYSIMTKIDNRTIEAAQDLGANTKNVFTRIVIPMSMPGISTGITMVFVPSVSTFIISRMLGGGGNLLIGDLIDLQFLGNAYNPHLGSAISLVLMVLILLCMSILNQFNSDEDREGMLL